MKLFHVCLRFSFYSTFNFHSYALCPLTGESEVKLFLLQRKVAQGEANISMNNYVCIEDPLVLDHNVGLTFHWRNIVPFTGLLSSLASCLNEKNVFQHLLRLPVVNARRRENGKPEDPHFMSWANSDEDDEEGSSVFPLPPLLAIYELRLVCFEVSRDRRFHNFCSFFVASPTVSGWSL